MGRGKKLTSLLAGLICSLGLSTALVATPFSVIKLGGTFSDAESTGSYSGIGTSTLTWGDSPGSSFDFAAFPPGSMSGNVGDTVNIASFTHTNNVIHETAITGATLDVLLHMEIDGVLFSNLSFSLDVDHTETPNSNPDPSDIVSLGGALPSTTLNANGLDYLVTIKGFFYNGSEVSSFTTPENGATTVILAAHVSSLAVPEPSTYVLLGSTLLIALWTKERRKVLV